MALKDNMLRDLDVIINPDEFAESIVYHHVNDDMRLNAIFLSKNEVMFDRDSGVDTTTPSILVKAIDVPDVGYGSQFTVRGVLYEVSYIPTEDDLPLSSSGADLLRLYISTDTKNRF